MDKIDGIDISECEYANACDKKLKCVILQDDVCETKPYCEGYNCYYKQLKRLQAENEQLKNDIGIYKGIIDADKEENERLKEELRTEKIYSSQIEELEGSLQHAKAENEELSESIKRLKNMAKVAALGREKYKQALQEIRELADIIANTNCYPVKEAQKIIDKINKFIGE